MDPGSASAPPQRVEDARKRADGAARHPGNANKRRPGVIPAFFHDTSVIVREGGRSSIPRLLDSIRRGGDCWMPAFAGMTT
jgi:hypothetical protein